MVLPPFDAGGVKNTWACPLPGVALTAVGAPGSVNGVTGEEGLDAGPGPVTFAAVTVKV
jgi:hypothetical protein